mgnify:CR=1 FL=1
MGLKRLQEQFLQLIQLKRYMVTSLYLDLILNYYETLNEYYVSYAELLKEMNINDIEILPIQGAEQRPI